MPASVPAAERLRLPPCTLLLVDDSPEDRAIYRDFLGRAPRYDFTFLEASDVEEALRVCRDVHIDGIILDFGLPDENGLEFLQRLRAEGGESSMAVVMVTGRGSEMVAVECLKGGAADYLMKSGLAPEPLARALHNALERSRMQEHLREEQREREQAEAELRDSEARFRLLIDNVRDYAIFMLDLDGAVSSWNAGARLLLGYHDNEIIGQPFRQLLTEEDVRARLADRLLALTPTAPQVGSEGWLVRRDGERVWMARAVNSVVDRFGVHRGFSVVVRDTVERRRSSLRLQQALRARDGYFAAAAAQLSAPLAEARTCVQALLRDGAAAARDAAAWHATLADADARLRVLAGRIDALFDQAALARHRMPFFPQHGDLATVVRRCLGMLPVGEAGATHAIAIERAEHVGGMWDEAWIGKVLASLTRDLPRPEEPGALSLQLTRANQMACIEMRVAASSKSGPPASEVLPRRGQGVSQFLVEAMGGTFEESTCLRGGTIYRICLPIDGEENARRDA